MVRNIAPYSGSEEKLIHVRTNTAVVTASKIKTVSISKPFADTSDINTSVKPILPSLRIHLLLVQPIIRPIEYVATLSITAKTNNSIRLVMSESSKLGCCRQDSMI